MSDTAVIAICGCILQIVGFLTMWVKLKYGADKAEEAATKAKNLEDKLDANTKITKAGVVQATNAASTASETKAVTEVLKNKLNGGVDAAVREGILPVQKALDEHAETDEANMKEINVRFKELTDYVHQRNHDLLNAIGVQSNKIETLLQAVKQLQAAKN